MAVSPAPPSRRLGNWERFTLAQANVDCPATVSFLATFPPAPPQTGSSLQPVEHPVNPTSAKLAIIHLLHEFPLLRSGIAGGRTRTPSFRVRDDTTAEDVLVIAPDEGKSEAEVIDEQANDGLSFDGSRGPLWRVVLYVPAGGGGGDGRGAGPRLCLTMSHLISDGVGMRNTFHRLLTLLHPDNQPGLATLPEVVSALPPTLEQSVDVTLTLGAMFRLARDELVKPKLRILFPRRRLKLVPYPPPCSHQPVKTSLLRLAPASTAALKALAKSHGLATLHPLLQGAILAAIVLASPAASRLKPAEKANLTSVTAISLRDPKLGHPDLNGNYISALQMDHPVAPDGDFFALCRAYATRLVSPSGRAAAKHLMGALSLVPDPKPKKVKPGTLDKRGRKVYPRTGYDEYMRERRDGEQFVESDVTITNLTVLPETGWEGSEGFRVCWGQTVGPFEPPLTVSVLTSAGGEMAIASN